MMISAYVEGLDEARAQAERMRANTENLEPALKEAGLLTMTAAMDRIEDQGPGWPANISHTALLHGTGRLLASLTMGGTGNVTNLSNDSIEVGTNLPVGRWMQDGTGIYGPRGEPIRPLRTEGHHFRSQSHMAGQTGIFGDPAALAFPIGGTMRFFRSVKGSPQRRFLFIDEELATAIRDVFARHALAEDLTDA